MEFKEVEALNGIYRVYEDGTVLSNVRRKRPTSWYELKHQINSKGYHRVHLSLRSGVLRAWRIHRLVAELFLGFSENKDKKFVNHKDCDKNNNHYTNLEWCTHAENILHAKMNMLCKRDSDVNGKPVSITFEFPTARTAERFFDLSPDVIARWARGMQKGSYTHPIVDVHYIEGEVK